MSDILWETNVGSHMWGMDHEKSDIDIFQVYMASPKEILRGTANVKSKDKKDKDNNTDFAIHEIGKVIQELITGNVNYIWGVTSPLVVMESKYLTELQKMIRNQPCANTYHSIAGLARHNWFKYIVKKQPYSSMEDMYKHLNPKKLSEEKFNKKLKIIKRTVDFGIRLLEEGRFIYTGIHDDIEPSDLLVSMRSLDDVYENSKLPREPNTEGLRNYLQRIRVEKILEELYGKPEDRQ